MDNRDSRVTKKSTMSENSTAARALRAILLATLCSGLSACGGGGGSTPAPAVPVTPSPSGPVLRFTPTTVTGTSAAGLSAALSVSATVNQPGDFASAPAVFAYVIDTTGTILPAVQITQLTPTTFNAAMQTAPTLTAGNYKGNFTVRVCRDAACAQHFPGSPMQLPFDVTITPPGAMTAVPDTPLNTTVYSNLPAPAPIRVGVAASGRTWTATSSASWIKLNGAAGSGSGSFSVTFDQAAMRYGVQSGTITLASNDGQRVELPVQILFYIPSFTIEGSNLIFNAINGAPIPERNVQFTLYQDTANWSATTTTPWLSMTPTGGTTPGTTSVMVSPGVSRLASGTHTGNMAISAPGIQTSDFSITLNLTKATLTGPTSTIVLGGDYGRDFTTPHQLMLYLNTQGYSHPWKLSGLPAWATANRSEGEVNQTGAAITLTPNVAAAQYGTSNAVVTATAQVNGDTVAVPLNLSFNLDRHKLLFSEVGIGFASTPTGSRLSRKVTVKDNYGFSPNWSVSSDQPWLTVSRQGNELTLTADPARLPANASSFANVSLSSTDASISTAEPLRVALWKGDTAPAANTKLNAVYSVLKADPIRPYVYANNAGNAIDVYNVYTATLVRTIPNLGGALGDMAISPNGDYLYAYDTANAAIVKVDLRSMAKVANWQLGRQAQQTSRLMAIRPNGVEIVIGTHSFASLDRGVAYLGATGALVGQPYIRDLMTATSDATRVYSMREGISLERVQAHSMDFSDMGGGTMFSVNLNQGELSAGTPSGWDLAVNADGTRIYVASSYPHTCARINPSDLSLSGFLTGGLTLGNNVEIGSDGRLFCGAASDGPADVWMHDAQGALLGSFDLDGALLERSLVISSDGMMMAVLTKAPSLTFVRVGP